jgi:hypothetical protein
MAIVHLCNSDRPILKETGFRILSSVPNIVKGEPINTVKQAFVANLNNSQPKEVQLAALDAAVSLLLKSESKPIDSAAELLPQMLSTLQTFYQAGDEDALSDALQSFIDLAGSHAKLFKNELPNLLSFCVMILNNLDIDEKPRKSSLELLLTITQEAPGLARKTPNLTSELVPICLKMMTEVEDDESWHTSDEVEPEDYEELYIVGEQAIDRLSRSIGGKQMVPVAFQYIPQLIQSDKWNERHAGLMAISSIGEGCVKHMEKELNAIIQLILPKLQDPHPRVRYAACNTIGQMSSDFGHIMQKEFHNVILSNLVPLLDDNANPRVQAHCAAATINFCEYLDRDIMTPYLEPLLGKLVPLLNSPKLFVQEQIVTTIATVADTVQDGFAQFYPSIMPLLINILQTHNSNEHRMLRGRILECATLIALAVGKSVFEPDFIPFVQLLQHIQQSLTDETDPQHTYLLQAWARVCKVMGDEFAPYLDFVMPPLIKTAQLKPNFAVLEIDESPESQYPAEDGWEFVTIDGRQVGINTSTIDDKCTAVDMLLCYARQLEGGFAKYANEVLSIMIPLIRFYFHDGVRYSAASSIQYLLSCYPRAQHEDEFLSSFHSAATVMLQTIVSETDIQYVAHLYSCLGNCLEIVGTSCFAPDQMTEFIEGCNQHLLATLENIQEAMAAQEEMDAEDEEAMEEEELDYDNLMSEMARCIHSCFQTHGITFLKPFDTLIPQIQVLLNHPKTYCRHAAVCIIDDVIEFCNPASWDYMNNLIQPILPMVLDAKPDVRQAASYGIGVAAQHGGENQLAIFNQTIPMLLQALQDPTANDEENVNATDNVISALTKIMKNLSTKIDTSSLVQPWFQALPIREDDEEAGPTLTHLLDLVEQQHPSIVGSPDSLVHLGTVIVSFLTSELLQNDVQVAQRAHTILQLLLQNFNDDVKTRLFNNVSDSGKALLSSL